MHRHYIAPRGTTAGERFAARGSGRHCARLAPVNRIFADALAVDGRAADLLQAPRRRGAPAYSTRTSGWRLVAAGSIWRSAFYRCTAERSARTLLQIRRALKPDGLFVAALFGGATLCELRDSFAAGEIETLGGITPAWRHSPMCASWAPCCNGGIRTAGRRRRTNDGSLSRIRHAGQRLATDGRYQCAGRTAKLVARHAARRLGALCGEAQR